MSNLVFSAKLFLRLAQRAGKIKYNATQKEWEDLFPSFTRFLDSKENKIIIEKWGKEPVSPYEMQMELLKNLKWENKYDTLEEIPDFNEN